MGNPKQTLGPKCFQVTEAPKFQSVIRNAATVAVLVITTTRITSIVITSLSVGTTVIVVVELVVAVVGTMIMAVIMNITLTMITLLIMIHTYCHFRSLATQV